MTTLIWTRDLDSDEMLEFFTYVESLDPPYVLRDGVKADKIRKGGRIAFNPDAQHSREAVYIKTKWG